MAFPYIAFVAVLLMSEVTMPDTNWRHLGGDFALAEPTPIAELTAHPAGYFNRQVRVEGIVASVCTQEGCFIEIVPASGGEGILVNFPELTEHFPTDCAGARAIVEGMFYQKVYPASRVSHWQGHSFRTGQHVPDFALIPRISARAASISAEKGTPPPPREITPAQTDRLDLAGMEFEAEGFGTGRKTLAPGDSTETHSTGKVREIILCLEGTITVLREGSSPIDLRPGEMSYIPPETRHGIRNLSDRPAVYVFVFSKAPEPEVEAHEH
jgi:quercetin dioxygenase-like cupin family protein